MVYSFIRHLLPASREHVWRMFITEKLAALVSLHTLGRVLGQTRYITYIALRITSRYDDYLRGLCKATSPTSLNSNDTTFSPGRILTCIRIDW
jgi:hypothetical protein